MWYMASYICGPSSNSARLSCLQQQQQQQQNHHIHSVVIRIVISSRCAAGKGFIDCFEYRELSAGAWFCVWSAEDGWGCGCLGTGGVSTTGGDVMGGKTGREEGIMYSDSSSLSRASSPVTGLRAEGALGTNTNIYMRIDTKGGEIPTQFLYI